MPPTYTGVGHGYRLNEETGEMEELFRSRDDKQVVIWWYEGGQIVEQDEYGPHWGEYEAKGRIETGAGRGSIDFETKDVRVQRRVLNLLVDKYPEIHFGVYVRGGPYSLQEYWEQIA